jgi:hypothetical protein
MNSNYRLYTLTHLKVNNLPHGLGKYLVSSRLI